MFSGKAHCDWSSGEKHYSKTEKYFDFVLCLFGNLPNQTKSKVIHQAGRIAYPFTFTLPSCLPSSFVSYTGKIRYELKGRKNL